MKYKKLRNGIDIPILGMGGWAQKEKDVLKAFEVGYRLIDTAAQYVNEHEVGNAILHSGINRKEIFITTKLWNDDVRTGKVREAFFKSLENLRTEYIDLYLIHYPAEGYINAWKEISELYKEGKIRSIGVSNFQPHHIDDLIENGLIVPMVNQVEEHPYFSNQKVVDYCNSKNIAVEAWCPLGGPGSKIYKDMEIAKIAAEHEKTISQVVLRWQFQRGIISIPKSNKETHMRDNLDIFDFELSKKEIEFINSLNRNMRLGADPDNFDF